MESAVDTRIIVDRLAALYQAAKEVPPEPERRPGLRAIDLADLEEPPSRRDAVLDRRSGIEYAAWCIGETLAAAGGRDLMDRVYGEFEDRLGPRASAWLDHRWSGSGAGWFA